MPQPVFILAAPRSYSSVFGAMLGQHPDAYGLPELNLFFGDTLGEAWNGVGKSFANRHDGKLRTLAELLEGKQTDAAIERAVDWVERHLDWPIERVFDFIQEAVGKDRLLVDKSPTITFSPKCLERLHGVFPEASFLHLVRHPRSTGRSLARMRTERGPQMATTNPDRLPDPEQLWTRCQSNAVSFCDTLPIGQWMRIKGEWVMSDPHLYLPQICEWLGLDPGPEAVAAMLHPEASPYACLGPKGAPFGNDPNFLEDPVLDWDRLARIEEPSMAGDIDWRPGEAFTAQTVKLARQFGYH